MDHGDEVRMRSKGLPAGKTADPGAASKPARAPRKKDPKLDLDLLEADGGFNDIWHKMAPTFKASFQGEGHEVADLRRLLELYQRWQMRFYPHCDFDSFVTKLEKAGRSIVVKAKMGGMRQNLLGLIFPADEQGLAAAAVAPEGEMAAGRDANGAAAVAPIQAGVGAQATSALATGGAGAATGRTPSGEDEDQDDELVALQREAEWEAAYEALDELEMAPLPPPRQQQLQNAGRSPAVGLASTGGGAVDHVDMEELAQLAEEMRHPLRPPVEAAALADQLRLSDQKQVQAAGTSGKTVEPAVGDILTGGGGIRVDRDFDEDEELIALAMGYNDALTAVAPAGPRSPALAAVVQQHRTSSADIVLGQDPNAAVGAAAADVAAAAYLDVCEMHGDGGVYTDVEVQEADMEDEDEELRMLAAMDTSEAQAVSIMRRSAICASTATALSAQAEASAVGMDLCNGSYGQGIEQYTGTEEIDAELLAFAADDTQGALGIDYGNGSGNIGVSTVAPHIPGISYTPAVGTTVEVRHVAPT
ncbi:hypothetical protein VaNZ11_000669 [Volvox africanus]|uniref:Chromosome segregation in meiosis protein 3 domain-containing protein n=1 Tax=Volvox africanus TaxID=51714 RepID=A0ABQ5RN24_9CHLO|nr:hypothetical protein VaNZ11_000669 [Volvox africanus]